MASTPNDANYKYHSVSVMGHNFLIFSVQACSDAHLALSTIPGNTKVLTYEIVIGAFGNTRSIIKDQIGRGNGVKKDVRTPNILDCNRMSDFWISWKFNTIRMGGGGVPFMYEKISWQDPNFHSVYSIGLMTGFGSTGVWKINSPRGRLNKFWLTCFFDICVTLPVFRNLANSYYFLTILYSSFYSKEIQIEICGFENRKTL